MLPFASAPRRHSHREFVTDSALFDRVAGCVRDERSEAALVGGALCVIYLVVSLSAAISVGAFQDDGVYLVLGRALAEGHGYRSMHLVGWPVQVKYPPGFPFVLAVLWRVAASVNVVQRIVGVLHPLVIGVSAGLLWWLGRAAFRVPRSLLLLLVITPLLFDASIDYYTILLSEPWFILAWAAALVLGQHVETILPGPRRMAISLLLGSMIAMAVLMRSTGLVLLAVLPVSLGLRRAPRDVWIGSLTAAVVPLIVWWSVHSAMLAVGPLSTLPDESSYWHWMGSANRDSLGTLWRVVASNLVAYRGGFATYYSGDESIGAWMFALLVGGPLMLAVLEVRARPLLALSALGGVAMVLTWPVAQDRLLLPVLPFLGLAAAVPMSSALARSSIRVQRAMTYVFVLMASVIVMRQLDVREEAMRSIVAGRAPRFFSPSYSLLQNSQFIASAARWIKFNTRPSDHVMIDLTAGVYLYTSRATSPANPSESPLEASVFADAGRYLATRILGDSITFVLTMEDALPYAASGGRLPGLLRDIDAVKARCPGVVRRAANSPADVRQFFHVRRDESCLRGFLEPR
jgi:hypothetical protein